MGQKNKIVEGELYFLTLTVVDWVDVFTRPVYKNLIVDSLIYCQREKGLQLMAWVLMTNHLHLISSADEGILLSDILRDFKKFTSKKIVETIRETNESRKEWMLHRFQFNAVFAKNKYFKVWQGGNEAKEIHSSEFFDQKLEYIHQNPVRQGIVFEPWEYVYSSASNYAGKGGLIDVVFP